MQAGFVGGIRGRCIVVLGAGPDRAVPFGYLTVGTAALVEAVERDGGHGDVGGDDRTVGYFRRGYGIVRYSAVIHGIGGDRGNYNISSKNTGGREFADSDGRGGADVRVHDGAGLNGAGAHAAGADGRNYHARSQGTVGHIGRGEAGEQRAVERRQVAEAVELDELADSVEDIPLQGDGGRPGAEDAAGGHMEAAFVRPVVNGRTEVGRAGPGGAVPFGYLAAGAAALVEAVERNGGHRDVGRYDGAVGYLGGTGYSVHGYGGRDNVSAEGAGGRQLADGDGGGGIDVRVHDGAGLYGAGAYAVGGYGRSHHVGGQGTSGQRGQGHFIGGGYLVELAVFY